MKHALIIEDNLVICSELSRRLESLGFRSFDHVWTEEDAFAVANKRPPDLVLVGYHLESVDSIKVARQISQELDVPVLLITTTLRGSLRQLNKQMKLEGPYTIAQLSDAVNTAQNEQAA